MPSHIATGPSAIHHPRRTEAVSAEYVKFALAIAGWLSAGMAKRNMERKDYPMALKWSLNAVGLWLFALL